MFVWPLDRGSVLTAERVDAIYSFITLSNVHKSAVQPAVEAILMTDARRTTVSGSSGICHLEAAGMSGENGAAGED